MWWLTLCRANCAARKWSQKSGRCSEKSEGIRATQSDKRYGDETGRKMTCGPIRIQFCNRSCRNTSMRQVVARVFEPQEPLCLFRPLSVRASSIKPSHRMGNWSKNRCIRLAGHWMFVCVKVCALCKRARRTSFRLLKRGAKREGNLTCGPICFQSRRQLREKQFKAKGRPATVWATGTFLLW